MERKLEHIGSNSLSARIYEELRRALIAGDFSPGERLTMQELAKTLGTSVTPVREACLRLVTEQALELRSGRFVHVPDLTRSRYWQIRLIRTAIEGLATRRAAELCTADDIAHLRRLHDNLVTNEAAGRRVEARHFNQKFHLYLYSLARMDLLLAQIEGMWASMGPILNAYYLVSRTAYAGAKEHLAILDALERRDSDAAAAALERDIIAGGAEILAQLDLMEAARPH